MTSSQLASGGGERPPVHCDARGPGQDRAQASDGAHPQEARARLLRLCGWQAGLERQAPSLVPSHSGPPGAVLCSYSRWTHLIYVSMSQCPNFCQMSCWRTLPGGDAGWGTASGRYHSSGLRSVKNANMPCSSPNPPRSQDVHVPNQIQHFPYLKSRVRVCSPLWPR